MALKDTIAVVKGFADVTNTLDTLMQEPEFYTDGYHHSRAMKLATSYRQTNIDELINSIWLGVDDNHSEQLVFDLWKQQLNTIALPIYDDAHFSQKFGGLKYFDEAVDIREMLLDVCGELKRETTYFADANGLKDNSPKKGFLCPLYYEDNEVTTEQETSQQGGS
jgi:hypothetical protein